MPRGDGTGPAGQGPGTGRGRGRGQGQGRGQGSRTQRSPLSDPGYPGQGQDRATAVRSGGQ